MAHYGRPRQKANRLLPAQLWSRLLSRGSNMYSHSQSGENGGQRALHIFDRRQMDDAARDRCATSVALRVLSAGAGADEAVAEASLPVSSSTTAARGEAG